MVRRLALWCVVAAAATAASCGKSSKDAGRPAAPPPATAPAAAPVLWRPTTHPGCFDPGDLLEVRVNGLDEPGAVTGMAARVQADGTISLPLLNGPVPVVYLDRAAAGKRIGVAYREANVLSHAEVDVRRLAVAGASVAGPIGNYDLVRCEVQQLEANGRPSASVGRVDDRGLLSVPLLAPVAVAGLTETRAAAAVAKAYREANVLSQAQVSVLVLERAPADAAHKSLPDGPIEPVPIMLRDLYLPR